MRENINLINLYVKYSNREDDYLEDYQKEFSTLQDEMKEDLLKLDLNRLIEIYLQYITQIIKPQKKDNYDNFLNLLKKIIVSKIVSISLINAIDLYVDICNNTLKYEEDIDDIKRRISVRKENLEDNYYIERESLKQKLSKEEFLDKYQRDLNYYINLLAFYQKYQGYLNDLKNAMLIQINSKLEILSESELEQLIAVLGKRIESNLNEKERREKILSNKAAIEIESRFKNLSVFDIYQQLETLTLKNANRIYGHYRDDLLEIKEKNTENKK